jgi:hypothetical protein
MKMRVHKDLSSKSWYRYDDKSRNPTPSHEVLKDRERRYFRWLETRDAALIPVAIVIGLALAAGGQGSHSHDGGRTFHDHVASHEFMN